MSEPLQTTFGSLLSALQALTPGSVLAALALGVLVALLVFRPVLSPRRPARLARSRRDQLEIQKTVLLEEIRDLDFDQETEKVAPEAYTQRRAALVIQAAELLRQIDAQPAAGDNLDARIEAAIAQRRGGSLAATLPVRPAVPLSTGADETPPPARIVNFCPQCGQRATPQDRFCAACGHQLV